MRRSWTQSRADAVRLSVFDASGRLMAEIEEAVELAEGTHSREWAGTDPSGSAARPGLDFAVLQVGGEKRLAKITLVR